MIHYEEQAARWSGEVRERYYNEHEAINSFIMLSKQYTNYCYRNIDRFDQKVMLLKNDGSDFATGYV
jgi:hypothetical protein